MKLETIIDILGKTLNENLVIKRELKTDSSFKIYKTYSITLYDASVNPIVEVLCTQQTDRFTEATKDKIIESVEKKFLEDLFKYYVRT